MKPSGNFLKGFFSYLGALLFILRHPSLLIYFLLACLLNAMLIAPVTFLNVAADTHKQALVHKMPAMAAWLVKLVVFVIEKIIYLLIIVVGVLPYIFISLLVGGWFYRKLAQGTIKLQQGQEFPQTKEQAGFWDSVAKFGALLKKLFLMLLLLPLNLIPVVGQIPILLLSSYYTACMCLEIPLTERGYGFRAQQRLCRPQRALLIGLGLAVMLPTIITAHLMGLRWQVQALWITLACALTIPLGIVAGALLTPQLIETEEAS